MFRSRSNDTFRMMLRRILPDVIRTLSSKVDPNEHGLRPDPNASVRLAVVVGHSSSRTGAHSPWVGSEFDFNTDNANEIRRAAIGTNCDVKIFFRDSRSNSISDVAYRVNQYNPNLVVALHFNGFHTAQANGTETLYWHTSIQGKKWAGLLQRCALNCFGLKSRGLLPIEENDRGDVILSATAAPCVILEPGFGTNKNDSIAMMKHWPTFAKEIVDAALVFGGR